MTIKEFRQSLRRGIGSAIIEISNSNDKEKYIDIVEYYCKRDISYDVQSEGTKSDYLYFAIWYLDEIEYFEEKIIKRFLSKCSDNLCAQLARLLYLFGNIGYQKSIDALVQKYEYFNRKKGRLTNSIKYNEAYQREIIVEHLFYLCGFPYFIHFADTLGQELLLNPDNTQHIKDWDWFLYCAEKFFSKKRIETYFEKNYGISESITAYMDFCNTLKTTQTENRLSIENHTITVQEVINTVRASVNKQFPRTGASRYRTWLHTKATETEISEIKELLKQEEDDNTKALLLLLFSTPKMAEYITIDELIEYACSDSTTIVESVIEVLAHLKDRKIHDLAIELLMERGIESGALRLLVENYRKDDDALIQSLIIKLGSVSHHIQMDIASIYQHHRSANAFPILFKVYQKGDCSFCRERIVRAMNHCGVLSDELLNECLFDSYDRTRKYAKRVISARNRRKN
ncbi:MAG: hypothetical protein FWG88_03500 [Oscillospiraceae bacterium]|nr:hypothetical protein [Oscillospiraceae bacterium]